MRVRSRSVSWARCASSSSRSATGDRDRHGAVGRVDVLAAGAARARGAQRQRRIARARARRRRGVIGRGVGHPSPLHTMPHARLPRALPRREAADRRDPPAGAARDTRPRPAWRPSIAHALAELATYRVGELDGVLVENEHDQPHRVEAGRETIAVMTAVTRELVAAAARCRSASRSCSTIPRRRWRSRWLPAPISSAPTTSSTR